MAMDGRAVTTTISIPLLLMLGLVLASRGSWNPARLLQVDLLADWQRQTIEATRY